MVLTVTAQRHAIPVDPERESERRLLKMAPS